MYQRVAPRWQARAALVRQSADAKRAGLAGEIDLEARQRLYAESDRLREQLLFAVEAVLALP